MTSWQVGMVCNGIIAVAYLLISGSIVVPLARSNQLRTNRLGAATAAIFFTCALHHGAHAAHMLVPALGVVDPQGIAMRRAWDWSIAGWDVVGAVVALYYWSLRRTYSSLMQGAKLFEDMRLRERQALEINDNVLQGAVVAKMSLELGDVKKAEEALASTIAAASSIITGLLDNGSVTGSAIREHAALVHGPERPAAPTP